MKIITGSTGIPHVTSNNAGDFNQTIFGTGSMVFDIGGKLAASLVNNNTITIADGNIIMQGRHALIEPGTMDTITIDTGAVGMNRNDLIVARYALDSGTGHESITLQVIKGTETAGTAVDPSYATGDIRTGSPQVDFPLYRVALTGVTIASVMPLFDLVNPITGQIHTYSAGTGIQISGAGAISVKFGTSSSTACKGNDSRLSDARDPKNHTADKITGGTLGGKVIANATAVAALNEKQVRNIYAGTTDLTPGTSELATGDIYIVYE